MFRRFLAVVLAASVVPCAAVAQAPLLDSLGGPLGYGDECLSPNDDGSSTMIDLTEAFPGGLEFFGRRHTVVYVNTNGNITFSGPLSQFTPDPFPVADQPMIAPYWADVDIRPPFDCLFPGTGSGPCENPSSNGVWWELEPGRMVVTWHRVGYFECTTSRVMSFQLVLTEGRLCGVPGDFDVEFRYNQCEWESGDASGGTNGFGGTQAQVGFDAGNEMNFVSVPGSRMAGISTTMCTSSNVGQAGIWRFQIRRGDVQCPDAGQICDTGMMGACGVGQTQCEGAAVSCEVVISPSDETCDAIDNDCDGMTDEDEGLCPVGQVCDRGSCIEPCFEGGCPMGQTCSIDGVCTDDACAAMECEAGERCIEGTCIDVCDGVVCPAGLSCRAGRCLDLCESLTCSGCEVCREGVCALHCAVTGCPSGQSCDETGQCVEDACLGVRCGPQRACVDGRCADSCLGAICPIGEMCQAGACVPAVPMPDAGPPDAGPRPDAGPPDAGGGLDAGGGGVDAGPSEPAPEGCGCRSAGVPAAPPAGLALGLLVMALIRRRTR